MFLRKENSQETKFTFWNIDPFRVSKHVKFSSALAQAQRRNIANSVRPRSYFSGISGFAQNSFIRSRLEDMPVIMRSSTVRAAIHSTTTTALGAMIGS